MEQVLCYGSESGSGSESESESDGEAQEAESKTTLSFKGGDLHLGLRGLESLFAQSWFTVGSQAAVVQCGMLWRSEAQKDKEQESRLYVQSEAKQASNTTDSVKRAFAVICQRWKNECGISVTKEPDASGNLVYSMKIPDHTSKDFSNDGLRNEVPAHGVLFVSLQLPHVKGVDSNIALQKAIERAVHHVVAQFAAADCIFFTKNRQKRRRHAPGIAQKLARMLCRIGDERTLLWAASAAGVELAEEDVKQIAKEKADGHVVGAGNNASATCLKVQRLLADGECGHNNTSRRLGLLFAE